MNKSQDRDAMDIVLLSASVKIKWGGIIIGSRKFGVIISVLAFQ